MTDLQAMLMAQEGTGPMRDGRFFPYADTRQLITIGYGRCLDRKGLSDAEAMMLFQSDIADAVDDVRHVCSVYDQLSRPRQMVLVSMAFNLGRDKLGGFVHFLGAVHRADWDEAAEEILNSKAAKVDAPSRYKTLAQMMRENVSQWL
jgi:lysozyme